ncbi:MAG: hypothetical protein RI894_1497 [Bacteroidota bacterium]|jgi:membrane associated rhomboid family serine protease
MDAPITVTLVIITGIISFIAFNNRAYYAQAMFSPYQITRDRSYYRFISAGFVHADFTHLMFNMLSLWMIGRSIEGWFLEAFGSPLPYVFLYFGGLVASAIPDYFKHRDNPMYRAIGASGAVSGVIFALIFFEPWDVKLGFFIIPPIIPSVIFGGLYLAFSSYMSKQNRDNIGHDAHFWGGVWGFFFTMVISAILRPDLVSLFIEKLTHPHF